MKKYESQRLRNIALVGHAGTGKTSLNEALLFDSKMVNRLGRVLDGNTVSDFHPDEIERNISINASLGFIEFKDTKINLIDTPGYKDFLGEVMAALKVADTALLVVDASSSIDAGTTNIYKHVVNSKLPCIIFVNKLDKSDTSFEKTLQQLQDKLSQSIVPLFIPIGTADSLSGVVDIVKMKAYVYKGDSYQETAVPVDLSKAAKDYQDKLIEAAAASDDNLTEKYLERGGLTPEELGAALKKGILEGSLIPVLAGSATKNIGVHMLPDIFSEYLPSPLDRKNIAPDEPFKAMVFKTMIEPHTGEFFFFKIYSGHASHGMDVINSQKDSSERIGQILLMQGKNRHEVNDLQAGDIGVVAKLKTTTTNNTLCDPRHPATIEPIEFPSTAIDMSVYARSRAEEEKVGAAFNSLAHEDPTFKIHVNNETNETIISGMGSLHLEIIVKRLKERFGLDVDLKKPKIAYKETIKGKTEVQGKYKRQSGGRGQYGDVWLRIEPQERGIGFEFVDKIVGGAIPRNYIPSVQKGVKGALDDGVISGHQVVDVRVTLFDGSFHEVDSSDMAFKIAGSMAFRKGVQDAKPCILEPVMQMDVIIPEDYMGAVIGDMNGRRGRVLGMDREGKNQVIKAYVPQGEIFKYATDLRSMTHGEGNFRMKFSHYEDVPAHISQKIVEEYEQSKQQK